MTEDMVKQQAEVFESLGTSDDAAKIRAQLQSAHLLSDMQAFKAANPKAVFNDFVRWHSPKDWITEGTDDGKPQLSARMAEAGNLWLELWQVSNPQNLNLFPISIPEGLPCFFVRHRKPSRYQLPNRNRYSISQWKVKRYNLKGI